MIKVSHKYEVLYNDLVKHNIGDYLISRDFKSFMTSKGYYEEWDKVRSKQAAQRHVFSVEVDINKIDADSTFIAYLNFLHQSDIEMKVAEIIYHFIISKKDKEDFSDILDSVKLSKLKKQYIDFIEKGVRMNASKKINLGIDFNKVVQKANATAVLNKFNSNEIFIVHGHNEGILSKVKLLLKDQHIRPVVLNEQANGGKTVIEKFEKHSDVSFAIILITGDDFGNSIKHKKTNKRARQNVILELGYFIGKLGRERVVILNEADVEWPSDLAGVVYIPLDVAGLWELSIIKELKAAGFKIDANHLISK